MEQLAERPRAVRYEMSVPVAYRCVGDHVWRTGQTANISRSGVLFHAAVPVLPASTRIQFVLELPGLEVAGGAWVQCEGQVVRHGAPTGDGREMAATIDAYELLGTAPDGIPGRNDS